jgi:hypothetical protein
MPLEIRHVSLAQLLSNAQPFTMARYQRHYEWSKREMDELLDDLGEAYAEHVADPARGAFHFLGNIILYANPAGHIEVVDGQQRLTSLTLLLAAARDVTPMPALSQALQQFLFAHTPAGPISRLTLHRGDHEFLRDFILPPSSTTVLANIEEAGGSSARHLRANAIAASAWMGSLSSSEQALFLRFALEQGRFVEITVGEEDDAFRIFETVNNRGRPIASEDVLRYALVEYATDDQIKRDAYLTQWDEIEAELGPKGMKRFIAGWRARVTKGTRPRQSLHRIVLDSFNTPAEARAFLDTELSGDLSVFQEINTANVRLAPGPDKARVDTLLRSFALLDFDEWLPVVSDLVARGRENPQRLATDLARVERLAWYFYLNGGDKGIYLDRRDRFGTLMKTVAADGTLDSLPRSSLLSVEAAAKMRDILQSRLDPKWIPLRSLLVRLEMALAGDTVVINRDDVTIEHVLPVRPKAKAWMSLYGNSQKTVTDFAERIGNLCLVSNGLNTELGNQTFPNKQRLMIADGVTARSPLAADIASEPKWTRDVIERRSKKFLQVFCDTFDIHAQRR